MNKLHEDLPGIGRLIFELTSVGLKEADLDDLLERLYSLLSEIPGLPVWPKGAILLKNPRQELVLVASYGLQAAEGEIPLSNALDGLAPEITDRAYIATLSQELGESWAGEADARFLVMPLTEGKDEVGVTILCIDPAWNPEESSLGFLTDIAHVVSGVVSRCVINETLRVRELELEEARADAIRRLGAASEYRDNETGMHVMRMTHYAAAIGKHLDLTSEQLEHLTIAAPMHDVGKIGISDMILLKPDKLTEKEFESMKNHTTIGGKLLTGKDTLMAAARDIAMTHHEHWDGSGYPNGLAGKDIPVLGRVCAVADVFDALTSDRPYKQAWSVKQAVDWIEKESGSKFDPTVVEAFQKAFPEILRIKELYREDIIDPNQVVELPVLETGDSSYVKWSDDMRVGIDVIDEHHRYLFDLVNDLHDVITAKQGARDVARILNALTKYAQVHFRAEERMMDHYGYSALDQQKHQHHHFEEKIKDFYNELHVNPLTAQFDILTYLRDWLVKHIRVEDAKLGELVDRDIVA